MMSVKKMIFSNILMFIAMLLVTYFFIEDKNISKSLILSFSIVIISLIFDIRDYIKNNKKDSY